MGHYHSWAELLLSLYSPNQSPTLNAGSPVGYSFWAFSSHWLEKKQEIFGDYAVIKMADNFGGPVPF